MSVKEDLSILMEVMDRRGPREEQSGYCTINYCG